MTLCVRVCAWNFMREPHSALENISQRCCSPAHTWCTFISGLKQGSVQGTTAFPLTLKSPLIDFMTHLRGMTCNLKDTVLKDIEQNSIQYWSLYVMEKWFINFFFLLCQYFNLDINVLKLFQKHMISSEFEIVSSKATVIIKWFVFLMVFKHLLR